MRDGPGAVPRSDGGSQSRLKAPRRGSPGGRAIFDRLCRGAVALAILLCLTPLCRAEAPATAKIRTEDPPRPAGQRHDKAKEVPVTGVKAVAVDVDGSSFLLDDDGSVRAFLKFDSGYLQHPYVMYALSDIVSLAPYGAVRRDGKVFTWDLLPQHPQHRCIGSGSERECEVNTSVRGVYTSPEMVEGIDNAVSIVAVEHYFLARLADGRVVEWGRPLGRNVAGRVPQDPSNQKIPPHVIPELSDVAAIAVADGRAAALTRSGDVFVWDSGAPKPALLYSSPDVKHVALSLDHTLILTKDGHVLYWGQCWCQDDKSGHYNKASYVARYVDETDNVSAIAAEGTRPDHYAIYIRRDGTVWSVYPPDPSEHHCFPAFFEPGNPWIRAKQNPGMTVPAISAGLGNGVFLVVGADHSLWKRSTSHKRLELTPFMER